jgi:hypothetical protein
MTMAREESKMTELRFDLRDIRAKIADGFLYIESPAVLISGPVISREVMEELVKSNLTPEEVEDEVERMLGRLQVKVLAKFLQSRLR